MATPLADPLDAASSVEDFEVLEVSEMGPEEMSLASVTVSQHQAEETRSNMTLSGISVSDYELVDQDTSNQLKNQLEALEELMLRLSTKDDKSSQTPRMDGPGSPHTGYFPVEVQPMPASEDPIGYASFLGLGSPPAMADPALLAACNLPLSSPLSSLFR